jgi:hypothetical protein
MLALLESPLISRYPICGRQDRLLSRITSFGGVVSPDRQRTFFRVAGTPGLPDPLALTPRLAVLSPQMEDFRERVLCLQQVIRICEEVWAIANMNVLVGVQVAENMRGALAVFDSDSLVGSF